jgi:flagellar protein FlaG
MTIESVKGISSPNEQVPNPIIPTTYPTPSQQGQVEQNRRAPLQNDTTLDESSERQQASPENLANQIKQANQLADSLDRGIRFFVHEDSGRTAVNVVDNSTHQVIKTVPPEQFLDLVAKVTKIAGIFFDEFA